MKINAILLTLTAYIIYYTRKGVKKKFINLSCKIADHIAQNEKNK
jgi:hypothetical protein